MSYDSRSKHTGFVSSTSRLVQLLDAWLQADYGIAEQIVLDKIFFIAFLNLTIFSPGTLKVAALVLMIVTKHFCVGIKLLFSKLTSHPPAFRSFITIFATSLVNSIPSPPQMPSDLHFLINVRELFGKM